ncbi:50S ribosomal protein L11 methyltransferase [candidate division KSB1 bacterium]|nr:50S ribosomal protein L11 methyltransferase [candidate division KSB1 bacterium]
MPWIEIRVPINSENQESITNFLFELGADGCVEENEHSVAYVPGRLFSDDFKIKLSIYLKELESLGFKNISTDIKYQLIEDQDWNRKWQEQFRPIKISSKFVVTPPWIEYQPQKSEQVIIIHPKMAFGTGSHETTQLVIQLMEKVSLQKKAVLDIGTGTAILAIVAAALGAQSIYAIDNDPIATECAIENLSMNQCTDKIVLKTGTVDILCNKNMKFDVILANIQKSTILEIGHFIPDLLSEQGIFITSGILENQYPEIIDYFLQLKFHLIDKKQMGEWVALTFQK